MFGTSLKSAIAMIFFCVCLAGFLVQGKNCFLKFLSEPTALKTSIQKQNHADFPVLTFCPVSIVSSKVEPRNPMAYDLEELRKCGVSPPSHTSAWFGNESCVDFKGLYERSISNLTTFGITR